jgi:hypothetical protein
MSACSALNLSQLQFLPFLASSVEKGASMPSKNVDVAPLQEPRLLYKDPKIRAAVAYATVLLLAVSIAILVAIVGSWNANGGIRRVTYYGSEFVRIALFCVSVMLMARTAGALVPDRNALSGPATLPGTRASCELVKSGVIISIHCTAVAASLTLLSLFGLAFKPLVQNSTEPSIITSLDLQMLPCFKVYMYFVLRELLWAQQIAKGNEAAHGPAPRLLFPPRMVPWVLWIVTPLCFSAILASRLSPDRSVCAPILFSFALLLNIPLSLHASSMFRALQQDSRWPSIRATARLTQILTALSSIVTLFLEAFYQFAPGFLSDRYATIIIDGFICGGQLPLIILGVASNGIVDRFWRNERAAALNALAEAHASVAGTWSAPCLIALHGSR